MVSEGSQISGFCRLAEDRDHGTVRAVETAVHEDRPAWTAIDGDGLQVPQRGPDLSVPLLVLTEGAGDRCFEEDLLKRRRLVISEATARSRWQR